MVENAESAVGSGVETKRKSMIHLRDATSHSYQRRLLGLLVAVSLAPAEQTAGTAGFAPLQAGPLCRPVGEDLVGGKVDGLEGVGLPPRGRDRNLAGRMEGEARHLSSEASLTRSWRSVVSFD